MINVQSILHPLFSLVYPPLCYSCRSIEPLNKYRLCLSCLHKLPFIANPNDAGAALSGKQSFPEEVAFFHSLFYYTKDSMVADMIHSIKYEGQYRMAWYLGELLGKELKKSKDWTGYSIVPVPIHKKRFFERGYNQSEEIAKGISKILELPIRKSILRRTTFESSQTGKGKHLRAEVLQSSFDRKSIDPSLLKVLLIDDVITTGSTINACFRKLKNTTEVSVASIGISI